MKHTAKRTTALTIALALMITAAAGCGGNNAPAATTTAAVTGTEAPKKSSKTGVLSLLRMNEERYSDRIEALLNGMDYLANKGVITYTKQTDTDNIPKTPYIVFYDSLDAMIMALENGDVQDIELTQTMAEYVVSRNDKLYIRYKFDKSKADGFDNRVIDRLSHGYSFMMLEDKTALRDEFNTAIRAMEDDGTLDKLKKTYIDDVIAGKDPEPVAFEKTDGETIKVAITGSLPPMDYISPDGTPAGFNTALLAEIGKRIGKNIELVQVDSIGRAAALASGTVDVVFWTRSNSNPQVGVSDEKHQEFVEQKRKKGTDEQEALMQSMNNGAFMDNQILLDMPDGTICTDPYFADPITIVALK